MSDGIFMLGDDNKLREMTRQPYDSEDVLQELLENYPKLLAGEQINSGDPRRWLLIKREMGVPDIEDGGDRWSLDHLFVDQDGVPTLVEAKLSRNPEARRKVVAQMLDYAANAVVHWPIDRVISKFEATCADRDKDPAEVLDEFIGGDGDSAAFWSKVKTNLQAERIRLLFVADEISPELRRIIEFLNGQMDPAEVLGVEIRQFVGDGVRNLVVVGDGVRNLVARVVGQTSEAERRKSVGTEVRRQWSKSSFFEELRVQNSEDIVQATERLFDWVSAELSYVKWGTGKKNGSFTAGVIRGDINWSLISVYTSGVLQVNFGALISRPLFRDRSVRQELSEKLNHISGIEIPLDKIDVWPNIRIDALSGDENLREFLGVISWAVTKIEALPEDELTNESASKELLIKIDEIVRSEQGQAACVKAAEKSLPPISGVDPLLQEELGDAYGPHNATTNAAGRAVKELMQELGYRSSEKVRATASGCVAKSGTLWEK